VNLRTTTWESIDGKLDLFLKDSQVEGGEYNYPLAMRIAAWNWATRMFAFHTPRQQKVVLSIGSDGRSAILPPDSLGVQRIYNADTQRWMRRMPVQMDTDRRMEDAELGQWWVWGGTLYLEQTFKTTSADLTLYYYAYWPDVEYKSVDGKEEVVENDIITPPWAEIALCHLTAAQCLVPGSIEAARLRQWNIRIDSGTPIQNSRAMQAREHLWWYNTLIGIVPPTDWL